MSLPTSGMSASTPSNMPTMFTQSSQLLQPGAMPLMNIPGMVPVGPQHLGINPQGALMQLPPHNMMLSNKSAERPTLGQRTSNEQNTNVSSL